MSAASRSQSARLGVKFHRPAVDRMIRLARSDSRDQIDQFMTPNSSGSPNGGRLAAAAALLGAVAAAGAAVILAVAGCGGSDTTSASQAVAQTQSVQDQIDKARQEGKAEAQRDQQLKDLQTQVKQLKKQQKNEKKQQHMQQTQSASQPAAAAPAAAPTAASSSFSACDSNISVAGASCDFANNTFWTYWNEGQSRSISVYDAGSGQYYATDCSYAGQIECRTSRGAIVRFPQAAVDLYTQSMANVYAASHNVG